MSNQTNKLCLYNTVHNTHLTVCLKDQESVYEKQQEGEDLRKIDLKLKILVLYQFFSGLLPLVAFH